MFKVTLALLLVCASALASSEVAQFSWTNERVVGGQNAAPHSAPWIVAIHWGQTVPSQYCGGSILTPAWVLTAAHCLGGQTDTGVFQLIAGRHNLANDESATEQRRNINRARAWAHESYAGGVGPFDIAIVHVAPAFVFNAYVRAIALPAANYIHSGSVTLHGWGSVSTGWISNMPNILQTVTKPIVPFDQCQAVLGAGSPLHSTNVCTGPLTGGISACGGDSGGPLVQNGYLVGVVSWGTMPCGSVNRPSVYVRVSAFNAWINQHMLL